MLTGCSRFQGSHLGELCIDATIDTVPRGDVCLLHILPQQLRANQVVPVPEEPVHAEQLGVSASRARRAQWEERRNAAGAERAGPQRARQTSRAPAGRSAPTSAWRAGRAYRPILYGSLPVFTLDHLLPCHPCPGCEELGVLLSTAC